MQILMLYETHQLPNTTIICSIHTASIKTALDWRNPKWCSFLEDLLLGSMVQPDCDKRDVFCATAILWWWSLLYSMSVFARWLYLELVLKQNFTATLYQEACVRSGKVKENNMCPIFQFIFSFCCVFLNLRQ